MPLFAVKSFARGGLVSGCNAISGDAPALAAQVFFVDSSGLRN